MEKKYRLTDETMEVDGHILHRIECVTECEYATPGQKGGWIENENNLSQDDNAWVSGNAMVYGNAWVRGNALISGEAVVYENAWVSRDAIVECKARIYGNAKVFGFALVRDTARVYGHACIYDHAQILNCAKVYGNAGIGDCARIAHNSHVYGSANVYGNALITHDAVVKSNKDYMVFKNHWSSGRYFTWTKSNDMWQVGCFHGTGAELIEKAYRDSKDKGDHYKLYAELVERLKELDNNTVNENG